MLRSPKERFVTSDHSVVWKKVIQTEAAEEAVHAALEQLAHELPMECRVPQEACDAHQQMIGARKYMEILCSIHTPDKSTKPNQPTGLDYQAGV